jgi:hypothetical protein
MQRIFPITEKSCIALCNKPVLIFLNDGSEIYGMLSRVEKGKLILNDQSSGVSNLSTKKSKKKTTKVKTKHIKAKAQASEPDSAPAGYSSFGFPLFGEFGNNKASEFEIENVAALFY